MFFLEKNEWEKQSKRIYINHLIVLCKIGKDYKSFCEDLENLIKSKRNSDYVQDAYRVMKGQISLKKNKFKEFVEKHKNTIDVMNEYNCLYNLTVLSYNENGSRRDDLPEDFFYQYIQEHKKDLETIESVLLKLQQLGFDKLYFDESLDFTKVQYELTSTYGGDCAIVENMQISPSYLNDEIKYTTSDSCYCISLDCTDSGEKKRVLDYSRKVYLNNLVFDPNRLPNELTTESTIGVIKSQAENKTTEYTDIKSSIDLNITIEDLKKQYEYLKYVVSRIDKIKDNEELTILLNQMQMIMSQLQLFGETFENDVIDSNPSITDEMMKKEKKLYLDRRYWASIDID